MNIPGSSGAEVLTAIKADPATDGVRVIIVTADGEEGRERAIGMGADEYFTKPFSPIALLQTVERVLSSPPTGRVTREDRTGSQLGGHGDIATHGAHQPPRDREPEPRALGGPRALRVR